MGTEFTQFKMAVTKQFNKMSKGSSKLYRADTDRTGIWETYLGSFPEGTNPVYQERTEHDCQVCKQFIRAVGNVVGIDKDYNITTIWDFKIDNFYQEVADAMAAYVKFFPIRDVFRNQFSIAGLDKNHQQLPDGGVKAWNHLYAKIPSRFVERDSGSTLSALRSTKAVFKRGLEEITLDSANTVLELIKQKTLYRGDEHKRTVDGFVKVKKRFDKIDTDHTDNFCWKESMSAGTNPRIRNSVIGTLMTDLSDGVDLDTAVKRYEDKVAPANYKRPKALVTKAMIQKAQKRVEEMGLLGSLPRRMATVDDLTINNILFANNDVKQEMNVFEELMAGAPVTKKTMDKVEEVSIGTFMEDILPTASKLELNFAGNHTGNLMTLVAPVNDDAPGLFNWGSKFSWDYFGGVADSMKQRVKAAGGEVDGVLRFSIQWNDNGDNRRDFDAHCKAPGNEHIFHGRRGGHASRGNLDVDIISPGNKVAVENITWPELRKMKDGTYHFYVKNYDGRMSNGGFTAEIEYDGITHSFSYGNNLRGREEVTVAKLEFSKKGGIKFLYSLDGTESSKEVWGIQTNQFHNVSMVLNSPNHWDGEETGNKHTFFILEGCENEGSARGFFNEFLKPEFHEDRKVFEMLGSKMQAERVDGELSGLGFSSTQRASVLCRVTGAFTRIIKINF